MPPHVSARQLSLPTESDSSAGLLLAVRVPRGCEERGPLIGLPEPGVCHVSVPEIGERSDGQASWHTDPAPRGTLTAGDGLWTGLVFLRGLDAI